MLSCLQIFQITLMLIGFFFERDMTICRARPEDEIEKPLYEIEDIKEHIQQFFHLGGMYLLVVGIILIPFNTFPDEKCIEQVDTAESLERDDATDYYSHLLLSFRTYNTLSCC